MDMKYRGVEYNLDPVSIERIESGQQGKYRGQSYKMTKLATVPVPQPVLGMTYRGVTYRTTPTGGTETVLNGEKFRNGKPVPIPVRTQSPDSVRQRLSQSAGTAELHRRNIMHYLRRRLLIAKAKGDRKLIQQLEQELQMFS
ncbi:DUF4278 domain-containing protein [Phormidium tenue FACHB-886]|nr:DUF4278 domain-containing protein [Phormidium tenue FACHB-886]